MDLCPSVELSHVQSIGELSQAQNIESERLEDPYVKAWLKWLERDKIEKQARKERLENQEETSMRWELLMNARIL